MESESGWVSSITAVEPNKIILRGYRMDELMSKASFADVIFLTLKGELPSKAESTIFNAILVAGIDHGVSAPSVLATRVIASGDREAIQAAIAGGILAIGDAHGGAGEATAKLLKEGVNEMTAKGTSVEETAENILKRYAETRKRIPGLGHRIHSKDPRSILLFQLADKLGVAGKHVQLFKAIEKGFEKKQGKALPINLDGAIAALICDMGLDPGIAKILFIISRVPGLAAHTLEEFTREKIMRIRVPYKYDGVPERRLP